MENVETNKWVRTTIVLKFRILIDERYSQQFNNLLIKACMKLDTNG